MTWRRLVPGMRGLAPAGTGCHADSPHADRDRAAARSGRARRARFARAMGALVGGAGVRERGGARAVLDPTPGREAQPAGGARLRRRRAGRRRAHRRRPARSRARPTSPTGSHLALAAGRADLKLGRNAQVRLSGPARLALEGTPAAIALRLGSGQVDAEVAHREPGETFAVITSELRVEVRGTHFSVGAAPGRSWVRVDEGRVEVTLASGEHRFVSTGETLASPPPPEAANLGAPGEAPSPPPDESPAPCRAAQPTRVARGVLRDAAPLRIDRARRAREHARGRSGSGAATAGRSRRPAARGAREPDLQAVPGSPRARTSSVTCAPRRCAAPGASTPRSPPTAVSVAARSRRSCGRTRSMPLPSSKRGADTPLALAPTTSGRWRPRRAARSRANRCWARWTAPRRWGNTSPRHRWRGAISPAFRPGWAPRARDGSPAQSGLDSPIRADQRPGLRRRRADDRRGLVSPRRRADRAPIADRSLQRQRHRVWRRR